MKKAPMFDGFSFDACAFEQDRVASTEVDVSRGQVIEALVVALVVVVIDRALDLGLEVAGQTVVREQDPVLQRLVPALDLALGLRMIWSEMWFQMRPSYDNRSSSASGPPLTY